jgi:IPT/TIG domain-containing protein
VGYATRASELALCALLGACAANEDVPAPLVSSVTPDHAPRGSVVRILGDHFCQLPEGDEGPCDARGTVQFGTIPGTTTLWTDTEIMVEVPQGLTMEVQLRVVTGARSSNTVTFTPS